MCLQALKLEAPFQHFLASKFLSIRNADAAIHTKFYGTKTSLLYVGHYRKMLIFFLINVQFLQIISSQLRKLRRQAKFATLSIFHFGFQ